MSELTWYQVDVHYTDLEGIEDYIFGSFDHSNEEKALFWGKAVMDTMRHCGWTDISYKLHVAPKEAHSG